MSNRKRFDVSPLGARKLLCFILASIASQGPVQGSDVTNYKYDSLGRLIEVKQTSSTATATAGYSHDAADNRRRVTVSVTGGSGGGGQCSLTAGNANPIAGYVDQTFYVPVTLSSGCAGSVMVNYVTRDGTAIAHQDYPPLSGSLTFTQAGTQYIRVWGNAYSYEKYYHVDFSTSFSNVTISTPSVYVSIEYP